jgi:LAO/AO transport system kinase
MGSITLPVVPRPAPSPRKIVHADATRDLIRGALKGDRVALARAISLVENEAEGAVAILDACFEHSGRGFRLGITGPPGAGKSTLVARLAQAWRRRGETVGIVAVDPTSPFSGGALLGDRVRMGDLAGDEGVFIRSMATRGSMGGLAVHTAQVCDVLDAAGFSRILIETVGVGQSELEVAQTADSTAVVLVPESGDTVQAMKAGLMEIGDLFVINKADRDGADRAAFAIRSALELRGPASAGDPGGPGGAWDAPVLLATALEGTGVEEVLETFERHLEHLEQQGGLVRRRRQRLEQRLADLLRAQMWQDFRARVSEAAWQETIAGLAERRWTPHQASRRLVEKLAHAGPDLKSARLDAPGTAPITTTPRVRAAR